MSFWLALIAMAGLAVLSIVLPLRHVGGKQGHNQASADQLRRLKELEDDINGGDVDHQAAPEIRAELERSVLDGLTGGNKPAETKGRLRLPVVVALLVPGLAVFLYWQLGRPDIALFLAAHDDAALNEPQVAVDFLLAQVEQRVASAPNDAEAWEILARTHLRLQHYDEAFRAAKRVVELSAREPNALLLLIDAIAMRAGGRFVPPADRLIDEVLDIDPDNANGLVLRGMLLMQRGNDVEAKAYWRRAIAVLPADAPIRKELSLLLDGTAAARPPETETDSRLNVTVSLAPEFAADLAPDTPVFIFARAASGPKAPLAVVRQMVSDLPLAVELTDQMAMVPGISLKEFDAVRVVARVALSGQPQGSSGDYEGASDIVSVAAGVPVNIEINRVLR